MFFFHTQGGKKGKGGVEGLLQWDSERERVLQALIQLLQLDIRSLWSLSLVEEEFTRYPSDETQQHTHSIVLLRMYISCASWRFYHFTVLDTVSS